MIILNNDHVINIIWHYEKLNHWIISNGNKYRI